MIGHRSCADPRMNKKATRTVDQLIGSQTRARRIALGMSQETLAEHIGLTFQQVQNYEQGKNRVTASGLVQIAEVLGTSIEFFLDLSQPQTDLPPVSSSGTMPPSLLRLGGSWRTSVGRSASSRAGTTRPSDRHLGAGEPYQ